MAILNLEILDRGNLVFDVKDGNASIKIYDASCRNVTKDEINEILESVKQVKINDIVKSCRSECGKNNEKSTGA